VLAAASVPVIVYRRSRFTARLPTDVRYTKAHYWLAGSDPLRIGLTPFATRMLGELAFIEFDVEAGQAIAVGETIGNLEGVKAISELYSPAAGVFLGANPVLEPMPRRVNHRPFTDGWLFEVAGEPESGLVDVQGYMAYLDETIDRLKAAYDDAPV
jgi:glycine cleavage system H protein